MKRKEGLACCHWTSFPASASEALETCSALQFLGVLRPYSAGMHGFEVIPLQRGSGIDVACMRRLAQMVKQRGIDVIHAHQYTPFFYAAAARAIGRSRPIVFTEQEMRRLVATLDEGLAETPVASPDAPGDALH